MQKQGTCLNVEAVTPRPQRRVLIRKRGGGETKRGGKNSIHNPLMVKVSCYAINVVLIVFRKGDKRKILFFSPLSCKNRI